MVTISTDPEGSFTLTVTGRLTKQDYDALVPELEEAMDQHGKLRVLVRLIDFGGWTPRALVEDLRFDVRHRRDFDRVAVVGERRIEELATKVVAPFFDGEVHYFESEGAARAWMRGAA
jgi:hypothetical protein